MMDAAIDREENSAISRGNLQKIAAAIIVGVIDRTRDTIVKLPRAHELSMFTNVGRDMCIKPTVVNDYYDHDERPITALLLTFMDASGDTTLAHIHPLLKESASRMKETSPNRDMQISTLTDATPDEEKRRYSAIYP